MQLFHRPGADVRAKAGRPLPLKRLVGFERVSLAQGASASVSFTVSKDTFALATETGTHSVSSGKHQLIFSCGQPGDEAVFDVVLD